MKLIVFLAVLVAGETQAAALSCAVNEATREHFCYAKKELRQNGSLRSFPIYKGGPNGANPTGVVGVFNCTIGYLRMVDRRGVIIATAMPSKSHIIELRGFVCEEKNVKLDRKLY